jgi:hypothetical protein
MSVTYRLFDGDDVLASVARVREVTSKPWPVVVVRGGVPGGVVDSASQL